MHIYNKWLKLAPRRGSNIFFILPRVPPLTRLHPGLPYAAPHARGSKIRLTAFPSLRLMALRRGRRMQHPAKLRFSVMFLMMPTRQFSTSCFDFFSSSKRVEEDSASHRRGVPVIRTRGLNTAGHTRVLNSA